MYTVKGIYAYECAAPIGAMHLVIEAWGILSPAIMYALTRTHTRTHTRIHRPTHIHPSVCDPLSLI